jgi:hypothetical protein
MNERATATQELLEEGFRSYVAVLGAIKSFKIEVLRGCRAALEEVLPRLEAGLGVKCTKAAIDKELDPDTIDKFGEDYAWIGAHVPLEGHRLWFFVGVYIDETEQDARRVQAYAGFYVDGKVATRGLFAALGDLRGRPFELNDEDDCVQAVEAVPVNAPGSYQKTLSKAVGHWLMTRPEAPLARVRDHIRRRR